MMDLFRIEVGEGPIVAAAIHHGHAMRPAVAGLCALSDADRLREEDPYTGELAKVAPTRLVGLRSRFEFDLNRPRDKAVYLKADDAWGLDVWHTAPAKSHLDESLFYYDQFYAAAEELIGQLVERHGTVVVLDIHTYNQRRSGAAGPPADAAENPDVNLGTGSMNRIHWAPVVDRFLADLRVCDCPDGPLDVRENVKFLGGQFSRRLHEAFPKTVCALAVEFKKTFMDEWTGEVDRTHLEALRAALGATLPGLLEGLENVKTKAAPSTDRNA